MKTVSIRRSLLTNLVTVVLLLGVAILGMTYLGGQRALRRFSQSLIDQTLSRTQLELQRFFDPVTRQLRTLRGLGEAGRLDLDDPEALNAQMSAYMKEHPWVTSCMVADGQGREHMLLRSGDRWRGRQSFGPEAERSALWWEWTDDPTERVEREEVLDYDPRVRPWYRGAVQSMGAAGGEPEIYWTEPYTFFTTQEPSEPRTAESG